MNSCDEFLDTSSASFSVEWSMTSLGLSGGFSLPDLILVTISVGNKCHWSGKCAVLLLLKLVSELVQLNNQVGN